MGPVPTATISVSSKEFAHVDLEGVVFLGSFTVFIQYKVCINFILFLIFIHNKYK